MFGPALLVNPVTQEGAKERYLYLPPAVRWYDFWTGKSTPGDQRFDADAPLDRIPLYVKAGSVLPLGPDIEYAGEKPDAPIELRIYRGANAHFDLYEDQGDTYNYEKGEKATIPIDWNESSQTLTIGSRTGSYPGMPVRREFDVVFVEENHGAGGASTGNPDQKVEYSGSAIAVHAR
jgi:alpha-D-xyloside xylohydrolase